ncbi:MAG: TonB-dependent receptor [Deltaproteobacteria bacterium]|nr:TonB-dependent receptor [Deltaproteobacteria bacterium]
MNNRIKQIADYLSICIGGGGGLYYYQGNAKNCQRRFKIKLNTERNKSLNVNYYKIILKSLSLFIIAAMLLVFNAGLANADSSTNSSTAKVKKTHKISEVTTQQILTKTKEALRKMNKTLTAKKIFKSTQTAAVLNRKGMKQAQDTGGGAVQALQLLPGVRVSSYGGNSGLARDEVAIRGIKVGWSSVAGDLEKNGIEMLFDGIPVTNLSGGSGGFDSNEYPIDQFFTGMNVIYGPGNPASRWYNSLGGTVNMIPIQPTMRPFNETNFSFGSFDTYTLDDEMSTGMHDGWDGIVAAGYTHANTFRTGQFNAPGYGYAFYGKLIKIFNGNSFSLGAYLSRTHEYRPNFIPVSPVAGITTEGLDANAPLYSQQTTGYYSSLPQNIWYKLILTQTTLLYSKLNLNVTNNLGLHTLVWYRHGFREHHRVDNYFLTADQPSYYEMWQPNSNTYGEKIYANYKILNNNLKFGEYDIYGRLNYTFSPQPTEAPISYGTYYNDFLSIFAQDKIKLLKNLIIEPGLDYVGFNSSNFHNENSNTLAVPPVFAHIYKLEPSIGINYHVLHNLSLYGNWAISYQNPTRGAYGYSPIVNHAQTPPIRNTDVEAGFKVMIKKDKYLHHFVFNANYFQNILTNETIYIYQPYPTPHVLTSNGSAYYKGVQISAEDDPYANLHLYANYTYQSANFKNFFSTVNDQTYSNYPVSNVPNSIYNIGAYYTIPENTTISDIKLWYMYTGSQYMFSDVYAGPTRQKTPSYGLVNLSINVKTVNFDKMIPGLRSVQLSFSVYNLLNKKFNSNEYFSSGGYFGTGTGALLANPGAPRMFFASVTAKF